MIELGYAQATSARPADQFYSHWINLPGHSQWSSNVVSMRVDGPVRLGARGVTVPKKGPKARFVVSDLIDGRIYEDTTSLPGAKLVFRHEAHEESGTTRIVAYATVSGPLAFLWTRIVGPNIRADIQGDLDRLVKIVEAE
jgi:uncharacterized membrane protein